jgi:hypothetical protein
MLCCDLEFLSGEIIDFGFSLICLNALQYIYSIQWQVIWHDTIKCVPNTRDSPFMKCWQSPNIYNRKIYAEHSRSSTHTTHDETRETQSMC